MSRSRKKHPCGTVCGCKSQKFDKQNCNRRFRRRERHAITLRTFSRLPFLRREITDPWDFIGDGKINYTFYFWNSKDNPEDYSRLFRK